MKQDNFFTKSEHFEQEYSIQVVRVGEVKPIEGKDKIGYIIINGFSLVVDKNEIHEGDIVFYALNETQLAHKFLSSNNLYSLEQRHLNDNFSYISQLMENGEKDKAKLSVGFFNKNRRVRMIRLGGVPSMGFIFTKDAIAKFDKRLKGLDMESLVGTEFDTVNGNLLVKKFLPEKNVSVGKGRLTKRNKRLQGFNRMVKGEFSFHYDTNPLGLNMYKISPDDKVTISVKMHGTSGIFANVLVKSPIQTSLASNVINKHVLKKIDKLKKKRCKSYYEKMSNANKISKLVGIKRQNYTLGYGNVYSSRTVVKNQYINKSVSSGYYDADVWLGVNEAIKPYLEKGMTVYGEIVGYVDGTSSYIQKNYDYGCHEGENKFMIYRITTKKEDGNVREWDVLEVLEWTSKLISEHKELQEKIHPIDVLYNGKLKDLYPDISTDTHWHENVLERMKTDERFGLEKLEPMCRNKVPREGIVVRKDKDEIQEAFKLKAVKFFEMESKQVDSEDVNFEK